MPTYCAAAGKVVAATKPPINAAIATPLRILILLPMQEGIDRDIRPCCRWLLIHAQVIAWAKPYGLTGRVTGTMPEVPHRAAEHVPARQCLRGNAVPRISG